MKVDYKKRDRILIKEISTLRKARKASFIKHKKDQVKRNDIYSNEIFNKTIKMDNCNWNDEYVSFEFKSYNVCTFEKTKFGKFAALSEDNFIIVSGKNFFYVKFIECCFDNIIFDGCYFIGSQFEGCTTTYGKAVFKNCCFRFTEIENNHKDIMTKNICTEFLKCNLAVEFKCCLADNLFFDNCKLVVSKFDSCEMPQSIFNKCGFYSVKFIDSNINKLSIIASSNYELEFYNTQYINDIDNEIYVSLVDRSILKKLSSDRNEKLEFYRELVKMYFTLNTLLGRNNINDDLAREYTYLYNYFAMKIKNSFLERFIFTLSWILCGFGERMGRLLAWFLIFIFSSSIAYMFAGISIGKGEIIKYSISGGNFVTVKQFFYDFLTCLHFSIVTFSTVGYGNIIPYGWSYLISAIQIIMGIVLIAIFTSVIVKKLIK